MSREYHIALHVKVEARSVEEVDAIACSLSYFVDTADINPVGCCWYDVDTDDKDLEAI